MADLFEIDDLRKLLRLPVAEFDTDAATVARRQAGGLLMSATGLTDWPTPIPDPLWSWGIELGAIAYNNPEAAVSEQIDDYRIVHDRERRAAILTAASNAYGGGPQYSFPEPDWHWTAVSSALQD